MTGPFPQPAPQAPSPPGPPRDGDLRLLIQLAVREDMGRPPSDKTVELSIPEGLSAEAAIVARKPGVLSGVFLLGPILGEYPGGDGVQVTCKTGDGSILAAGQVAALLRGPARTLLSAERVMLNFLSHLSGIATLTRQYVDAVAAAVPDPARRPAISDTRKTTPGFRLLDKYAVRCGGGVNLRFGLYDGVMLKDNHLAALKERLGRNLTLAELTARIRAGLDRAITLWLEVDTLDQLAEALSGRERGADIILLDNFNVAQMREAVEMRDAARSRSKDQQAKILLEASGGITLANLAAVAQSGVDRISIGALTHSAPILDLSVDFQEVGA